jgi:cytochrome c biogenesis protein CcmG, thiol:disulfide interchange protein DsbE
VKSLKLAIPLAAFLAIAAFLAVGLTRDPREVPSPFIGKPAPAFRIERLADAKTPFSPEDMRGKVPLLVDMSKRNVVPIVGLNYKDRREDGLKWLARFGDPYALSAYDVDGLVGIDYGVYGVPETFVIDKQGVIRYKQIGPITPEALEKTILPLIRKLEA